VVKIDLRAGGDIVRLAVGKLEEQTPTLAPAKRRGKAKR
jgi:hypothetical protein